MIKQQLLTILCAFATLSCASGQTYNVLTIGPKPDASAVGKLRFAEKSNSATRKHLIFEGPDSLGADVRYKWSGGTTAGCLSLGALSGGVYPITATGSCGGQWVTTGSDIYYSTGNVGMGTSSPHEQLDVNGAVLVEGTTTINGSKVAGLYLDYGSSASAIWSHDSGAGTTIQIGTLSNNGLASNAYSLYASSGIITNWATSLYTISAPTTAISGGLNLAAITGSTQCLQVNSSGDVSGSGAVCGSQWITAGSDIHYSTGNVGMGLSSPTERLDVNGAALIEGSTTINSGKGSGLYLGYGSSLATIYSHDNGGGIALKIGTLALSGASSNSYTLYTESTGITLNAAASAFVVASPSTVLGGTLTFSGITGSTQCLQVNSSGDVSGTGAVCGGGGGSVLFDSGLVSGLSASTSVNLTVGGGTAPAGYYKVSAYIKCVVGHASSATQADAYPLVGNYSGSLFVTAVSGNDHLQCGSAGAGGTPLIALPPALIYTDGSADLTFATTAIGFASSQQYQYRVYLESF